MPTHSVLPLIKCTNARTKAYKLAIFPDLSDTFARCRRISAFTLSEKNAAKTWFSVCDDVLFRYTETLPDARKARRIPLPELSALVSRMHAAGIIHGDIAPKNILSDGQIWQLTDFEPALRVIGKLGPALMGTPGYLHPDDVAAGRITKKTDMFAINKLVGQEAVRADE